MCLRDGSEDDMVRLRGFLYLQSGLSYMLMAVYRPLFQLGIDQWRGPTSALNGDSPDPNVSGFLQKVYPRQYLQDVR